MARSAYPAFSARDIIAAAASPPDRPDATTPELASNRKVRQERSDLGTLDAPASLAGAISRQARRKWP